MLNYLYCFDKNYNLQALTSIYSIINQSKEKANFFILHNEPESLKPILSKVLKHPKINKLEIINFDKSEVDFPKLENSHVSEATYFRLYLENYISKDIKYLIYIDPDVICKNNPEEKLLETISKLDNSGYVIAANTESFSSRQLIETSNRLRLKKKKYFNAGIMIISFEKWLENQVTEKLILKMKSIRDEIVFWDQDVMNSFFDGDYLELDNIFNFTIPIDIDLYNQKLKDNHSKNILFLHYAGKFKPWNVKGLFHPAAEYYQNNFRAINKEKYHISNNWKMLAIKDLMKSIYTLKFLKLKFPFLYILYVIKYLLRQNRK